jgi:hypothetical protein
MLLMKNARDLILMCWQTFIMWLLLHKFFEMCPICFYFFQLCVHVSTVFLKFMLSHTLRNYSKVPKLFVTRNPEPCFLTQVDQKFMSLLVM